jgi:DNA-directed RNA polymerase specialized sigma24 family protein
MSDDQSVTQWLRRLELGDEEAARRLWERYFEQLVTLARKELGNSPRRVADEEDVALSVFRCLFDGARRGQFSHLASRCELWQLLVALTAHKIIDRKRLAKRRKRGGGGVRGDSVFQKSASASGGAGFDQIIGDDPTPDFLAMMVEEHQRLMDLLPNDTLRSVASRRMEGYQNEEIARELGLSRRSIERKLQRIRQAWLAEVES